MIIFSDESTFAEFRARIQAVTTFVNAYTTGGIDTNLGRKMHAFRITAPLAP